MGQANVISQTKLMVRICIRSVAVCLVANEGGWAFVVLHASAERQRSAADPKAARCKGMLPAGIPGVCLGAEHQRLPVIHNFGITLEFPQVSIWYLCLLQPFDDRVEGCRAEGREGLCSRYGAAGPSILHVLA